MYTLEPGIRLGQTGARGRTWGLDLTGGWDVSSSLMLSGTIGVTAENNVPAWASNESFALVNDQWLIGQSNQSPADQKEGSFMPFEQPGDLEAVLAPIAPFDQTPGQYFVPIFGDRDTRSVDVTLRSNVTFTPTMSLLLYTQLFVAKGRYDRYRVLASPSEQIPYAAYPKQHDFALHSFNTNLVFRWEYRPGSTLFLVWSQGRFGDYRNTFPVEVDSPYEVSTADRLYDTFSVRPTNVFMIKFSYLFLR